MNESELIQTLAADTGLTKTKARRAVKSFRDELNKGDDINAFVVVKSSLSAPAGRHGLNAKTVRRATRANFDGVVARVAKTSGLSDAEANRALESLIPTLADDPDVPAGFRNFTSQCLTHSGPMPFNDEAIRVHEQGHLSDATVAAAVGAAPSTVRDWWARRSSPTGSRADRLVALAEVVDRLRRVMEPSYIPVWLVKPIEALDDQRPIDLLADGQALPVFRLISSLEDPVAA
jgi:nucleoid DNA-binding protein/DNA-binding transcriptional regulator YiaG